MMNTWLAVVRFRPATLVPELSRNTHAPACSWKLCRQMQQSHTHEGAPVHMCWRLSATYVGWHRCWMHVTSLLSSHYNMCQLQLLMTASAEVPGLVGLSSLLTVMDAAHEEAREKA